MKILNPKIKLENFFVDLRRAPEKALLLDYDGTLAPFNEDIERAFPYPGVLNLLEKIIQIPNNRLVIISGRWTKDLIKFLDMKNLPEIWGSHGIERLKPDGTYELEDMEENALKGLTRADEWVEENELSEYSEAKPGCLAVHWRALDDKLTETIKVKIKPEWEKISQASGLKLKEFDGGIELRVPGRNKGDAVRTILSEMSNNSIAAYLGDDLTDEDAFRALKGKGMGVLVRKELRETNADIWIKPPKELFDFLTNWTKITGGTNGNPE
jgi:trehalose 6-phosphate phosphatase